METLQSLRIHVKISSRLKYLSTVFVLLKVNIIIMFSIHDCHS